MLLHHELAGAFLHEVAEEKERWSSVVEGMVVWRLGLAGTRGMWALWGSQAEGCCFQPARAAPSSSLNHLCCVTRALVRNRTDRVVVIPCSFLQRDSLALAGFVSPLHGLCWTQVAERVQLSGSSCPWFYTGRKVCVLTEWWKPLCLCLSKGNTSPIQST